MTAKLIIIQPMEMKTLLNVLTTVLLMTFNTSAQFSENFDQNITGLSSNCWTINQVNYSTTTSDVINGTGSAYTNPPTNGSGERTVATPFLNMTSTSLSVSFNYKISSKIAGQATRTIRIGISDRNGVFTPLQVITLDKNSPTTVLAHNANYTIAGTGVYRLEIRIGGATGDGNSRVIFDDLNVSASAYYGPTIHCNPAGNAVNDTYSSETISDVNDNVLQNDQFPADNETYTAVLVTPPTQGTLVLNADGTFTYTPAPGYTGGTITFTYSVVDNGYAPATSNIATATINYSMLAVLSLRNPVTRRIDKKETSANNLDIRQNPVSANLNMVFTADAKQNCTISVYTISGAIVYQENRLMNKGKNNMSINLSAVNSGMYIVTINNVKGKTSIKFIKRG